MRIGLTMLGLIMAIGQGQAYKLTPFIADGNDNTAVIICPGGVTFGLIPTLKAERWRSVCSMPVSVRFSWNTGLPESQRL